ncbi:hypothetical protein [Williamsoniiplasma luminosum]|uniref:DED domain-containing protein n=1 Tax=Williamsoniiplasma luminosum TaxID=214888 RepID=A0A2S0NJA9_9MOLU|nr:hypothetical protein [Williamsoniiplasma luminosum]AVP49098.1 MAG: hypothetical protein C5T88_00665 [Williamsoniiplasma luminosum]
MLVIQDDFDNEEMPSFTVLQSERNQNFYFSTNLGRDITPALETRTNTISDNESYLKQTLKILRSFDFIKHAFPLYEKISNCFPNGIFKYRKNIIYNDVNSILPTSFSYLLKNVKENIFESRKFLYGIILGWIVSKLNASNDDYIEIININGNEIYIEIRILKEQLKKSGYIDGWYEIIDSIAMNDEDIIQDLKYFLNLE